MQKIIPITDLQRQAGQLVGALAVEQDAVVITQRGRAAAVLVSADRYAQIEADLARLDELELLALVQQAQTEIAAGKTLSHKEVKRKLAKRHAKKNA